MDLVSRGNEHCCGYFYFAYQLIVVTLLENIRFSAKQTNEQIDLVTDIPHHGLGLAGIPDYLEMTTGRFFNTVEMIYF